MTSEQPSPQQPAQAPPTVRGSALIVTNVAKLIGLGVFVHEALIRAHARDSVIAMCAILVMGAQVIEDVALRVIDRVFAR